jgi:hypothetical protein
MDFEKAARLAANYLRALPATVTVDDSIITMSLPGRALRIEAIGDDAFLIGPSPTRGGVQVQVTDLPRVQVNRAELLKRANEWVRGTGRP